jgi:hypothetical protein
MSLRGRIGAYELHARYDPRETTAKARATFLARFERDVDPDGVLPEPERRKRAEAARKAYFARLGLASARARSKKTAPRMAKATDGTDGATSPEPVTRQGAGMRQHPSDHEVGQ